MNQQTEHSDESSTLYEVPRNKLVKMLREMKNQTQIRRLIIYNAQGKTVLDLKFRDGITMTILLTLILPKGLALVLLAPLLAGFKIQIVRRKTKQINTEPDNLPEPES